MKVLVTGGAGFIGSHVVELLLAKGLCAAVVDNLSSGKVGHVPDDVPFFQVDLTNEKLQEVVKDVRPDAIVHLAAQADVRRSVLDPAFDATVNILGTLRLLDAAVRHGVRKVIFASSAAVYGEPDRLPVDEGHPIRPSSPYGISKHTVEHYLAVYRKLHGLQYTVLRYANVYGPRQDHLGEGGVVAVFCHRIATGQSPTIFGDGSQTRDFVYVGDVARANLLALGRGDGEVLNVSTGVPVSVNALFEELRQAAGQPINPVYAPARPGEILNSRLDNRRAAEVLGWRPLTNLSDGLQQTLLAFRRSAA